MNPITAIIRHFDKLKEGWLETAKELNQETNLEVIRNSHTSDKKLYHPLPLPSMKYGDCRGFPGKMIVLADILW